MKKKKKKRKKRRKKKKKQKKQEEEEEKHGHRWVSGLFLISASERTIFKTLSFLGRLVDFLGGFVSGKTSCTFLHECDGAVQVTLTGRLFRRPAG